MLLRCAPDLQAMGKCGVRSISTTARDGVLLKATVKGRGREGHLSHSRAEPCWPERIRMKQGCLAKKFPRRPLMSRWPRERGVLEPRRSEMKCMQLVLSVKE